MLVRRRCAARAGALPSPSWPVAGRPLRRTALGGPPAPAAHHVRSWRRSWHRFLASTPRVQACILTAAASLSSARGNTCSSVRSDAGNILEGKAAKLCKATVVVLPRRAQGYQALTLSGASEIGYPSWGGALQKGMHSCIRHVLT